MNPPAIYIQAIKKRQTKVGVKRALILQNLYDSLGGEPPHVNKERYRADHSSQLEDIDWLMEDGLIWSRDNELRLSPYALPHIKSRDVQALIRDMDHCFKKLRSLYLRKLTEPIYGPETQEYVGLDEPRFKSAMNYLVAMGAVWGSMQNRFPYHDSHLCLKEDILRYDTIYDIFLRELDRKGYLKTKKGLKARVRSLSVKKIVLKIRDHPIWAVISTLLVILAFVIDWVERFPVLKPIWNKIFNS